MSKNNGYDISVEKPALLYYSNPKVVKAYTQVGLYPAEELIISTFLDPQGTLLDIGCGAGRTSIPLAKKGYIVTAFDLVPQMIEAAEIQAKEHNVTISFHVKSALRIDFPPESFQYVLFSFNGFDHILGRNTRKKFIEDVFRILKPGGTFVLTSRSGCAFGKRWIAWVIMLITHVWQKRKWGDCYSLGDKRFGQMYLHYMSPFSLRKLLTHTGFKIVYFNSEKNIVNGRKASFFTNFSNDRMLFYVMKK